MTGTLKRALDVSKYIYLTVEALFMVTWLITLFVVQSRLAGIAEAESTRLGHAQIIIHFLIPAAAIALSFDRADPDRELSILYFIVFFAVFGYDYYSLTETLWSVPTLPGHEEIHKLEIALTSIAIGLTGFWLLWYGIAYTSGLLMRTPSPSSSSSSRAASKRDSDQMLTAPLFLKGSKE